VNQNTGWRLSAYRAFLKPVEDRPNLTIRTEAQLKQVLLDDGKSGSGKRQTQVRHRCPLRHFVLLRLLIFIASQYRRNPFLQGLEYYATGGGAKEVVRVGASKEVILSMGAVGSPQALMTSGIGPAQQLQVRRCGPNRLSSEENRVPNILRCHFLAVFTPSSHSHTHTLTHSLTHALTHSCTHALTHSRTHFE
jgi:choline dehydrogenase